MARAVVDVQLPKPRARRAPAGHVLYKTGQQSDCPVHLWCAYDGYERDRCSQCHALKANGCEHQGFGGRPASSRVSLCRGCGELFSSISAFDRHQTVQDGCLEPGERGLEIVEREFRGEIWTMWALPGDRPPMERA